eukprot:TRINITY_DN615_c0_g1_i1.p1 TRINITY_DN615_c0_g1~~TRINITY_DN615_c0_g1_i1.p1  ORF type:complete len:522 (-),score=183.79 TRINITY_DN615_c0_g1_i1:1584-3149(-)
MVPLESWSSYVWFAVKAMIAFFVISRLYRIFIREWLGLLWYRLQGFTVDYYFPLFGFIQKIKVDTVARGDANWREKEALRKDPNKKLFLTTIVGRPLLILYDEKVISEFMSKSIEHYEKEKVGLASFTNIFGQGIFFVEGERWKVQRRILSDAFHFDSLKRMLPIIVEAATKRYDDLIAKNQLTKVHVLDEYQRITGDVVCKLFFGRDFSDKELNGLPVTTALTVLLNNLAEQMLQNGLAFLFGPWILKLGLTATDRAVNRDIREFRRIAQETIDLRRKQGGSVYGKDISRHDFLEIMLAFNEKNKELAISDEEIIYNFFSLFLAGMDTTGHWMTLATYYMWKFPEMKQRIIDETNEFLPADMEKVTLDDLAKCKFMDAFLREALRFATPTMVIFPREAKTNHTIGGVKVLKGTAVTLGLNTVGFNEMNWIQPFEFRPERWMDEKELSLQNPYSFIPFSCGPRNCIGKYLAFMEAKIMTVQLLRKFEFTTSDPDFKLKMNFKFMYEPLDPLLLDLKVKAGK